MQQIGLNDNVVVFSLMDEHRVISFFHSSNRSIVECLPEHLEHLLKEITQTTKLHLLLALSADALVLGPIRLLTFTGTVPCLFSPDSPDEVVVDGRLLACSAA